MPLPAPCPNCGRSLPANAPAGQCPACLFRVGLALGNAGVFLTDDPAAPIPELEASNPRLESATVRYFGDYELIEEIGRGGMGVVYRARQVSLNRVVALKLVRAGELASEQEVARFRAEAQAAASLDHPHIVPIHEVGQHEGRQYFSMKLVESGSLAERIAKDDLRTTNKTSGWRAGQFDIRHSALVISQIARAVHYAHQRGILHRDLKPGNILIDAQGQPHVTDFGLARRLGADSSMTLSGAIVGTPSYIAPEQAAGAKQLTTAADVYSLGAILYELLAGRPPFAGATVMETLQKVMNEDPERIAISELRFRATGKDGCVNRKSQIVNPDLETICLKCLAKDPARRYGSAEALAEDLERWQRNEPIHARPAATIERLWLWCRRKPAVAGFAAAAVLAALLGVAGITWQWSKAVTARAASDFQRRRAEDALWSSLIAQTRAERMSTAAGRRQRSLEAIQAATRQRASVDLRNEAAAALAAPDLGLPLWTRAATNLEYCPPFTPDLDCYAMEGKRGTLTVFAASNHSTIASLVTTNRFAGASQFSPDGRWLAGWFDPGRLHVWEWRTQREVFSIKATNAASYHARMSFSTDSRLLAVATGDGRVRLFEVPTGEERKSLSIGVDAHCLTFAPGSDLLAVLRTNRAEIWNISTQDRMGDLELSEPGHSLAWHVDGHHLAVGLTWGQILLWDTATSNKLVLEGHRGAVNQLAFRPQGDVLLSASWDGRTRCWDAFTGRPLAVTESRAGNAAQFSRDGQRVAFSVQWKRLGVWPFAAAAGFRKLTGPRVGHNVYECAAFAPDDRCLVAGNDEGCWAWDLSTGREVWREGVRSIRSVFFHPDGDWLVASGIEGLFRWRFGKDSPSGFGERDLLLQPLKPNGVFERCFMSADGQHLAVVGESEGFILPWKQTSKPVQITGTRERRLNEVCLSPGGRLMATGTWNGTGPAVWDATTGRLITRLPGGRQATAVFMPDGLAVLIISDMDVMLLDTTRWQPTKVGLIGTESLKGRRPAFSPDGRLLALVTPEERIRLIDTRSGQEIVTLTAPDQQPIRRLIFNRTASRLAAATDNYEVQLWDLPELRRELARLGLDWRDENPGEGFAPRR